MHCNSTASTALHMNALQRKQHCTWMHCRENNTLHEYCLEFVVRFVVLGLSVPFPVSRVLVRIVCVASASVQSLTHQIQLLWYSKHHTCVEQSLLFSHHRYRVYYFHWLRFCCPCLDCWRHLRVWRDIILQRLFKIGIFWFDFIQDGTQSQFERVIFKIAFF